MTLTDETFETAFHRHWARVVAVVLRLVGNREDAEEIAIDVFLKLHRNPHPDGDAPAGWLYRTATRAGLNELRSRRRRAEYERAGGRGASALDPPADPGGEVERAETRARVRAVLAGMKERSAEILLLRHSGLAYAEIAAAVGVAPGSVGTMLARAEREFEEHYRRGEAAPAGVAAPPEED